MTWMLALSILALVLWALCDGWRRWRSQRGTEDWPDDGR